MDSSAFSGWADNFVKVGIAMAFGILLLFVGAGFACYRLGEARGVQKEQHRTLVDHCVASGGTLDNLNLCIDHQNRVVDLTDPEAKPR